MTFYPHTVSSHRGRVLEKPINKHPLWISSRPGQRNGYIPARNVTKCKLQTELYKCKVFPSLSVWNTISRKTLEETEIIPSKQLTPTRQTSVHTQQMKTLVVSDRFPTLIDASKLCDSESLGELENAMGTLACRLMFPQQFLLFQTSNRQ